MEWVGYRMDRGKVVEGSADARHTSVNTTAESTHQEYHDCTNRPRALYDGLAS